MLETFAIAFSLSKAKTMAQKYELVRKYDSLSHLYQCFIKDKDVFSKEDLKFLTLLPKDPSACKQFELTQKQGGWIWVWGDYPEILTYLHYPPMVLYGQGPKPSLDQSLLSVIGTRTPTPYGKRVTKTLVSELVQSGMGIISGMARGIDSIAHQETLDHHGYTVVVLAHGLDHTYPSENRKLKKTILDSGGTLISEYPWGVSAKPFHFRDRNRINAALSSGVLVVEAGEKSGTKITVSEALLLNKTVYSVVGPIDSAMSRFPNQLIEDGAVMVHSAQSILSDFDLQSVSTQSPYQAVDVLEKELLDFFSTDEPKSIESYPLGVNFHFFEVLQKVTLLELAFVIEKQPDGRYIRIKEYQVE